MEKGRADGVLVHAKVLGEDERDLYGVVDVRLAGPAALVAVVIGGETVGALDLLDALGVHVGLAGALEQPIIGCRGRLPHRRLVRRGGGGGLGRRGDAPFGAGSGGRLFVHDQTFPTTVPKLGEMGLVTWAASSPWGQCSTQSQKPPNSSRPCNPSR